MKDQETKDRMDRKCKSGEAEKVSTIPVEVVGQCFKMYPAKHERKRYTDGDDAAPHQEHVRAPTKLAPLKNEEIQGEIARYSYHPFLNIFGEVLRPQEHLPTSLPIERGRWSLQPHRISIGNAEGGEEHGKGVADESGVEVREVS